MGLALTQGLAALNAQEVPVGAVVVKDGKVIAVGQNAPIAQHDPTAHAEIVALRAAALVLGNYRLDGCELFVTLEPCAMCAGAILHARLKRVVFGAFDPKAGAAGSVLNLFEQPQLNHHTEVTGGVLESQCALPLRAFFQRKRLVQRIAATPLREDALRTPDTRFDNLPQYPWAPHYVHDLPVLAGLRMHYLDEGPPNAPVVFLCLHDDTGWSYAFRKMVPVWIAAGCRVVVPDAIGFGKSDKPKRVQAHTFDFHRQSLLELSVRLDLQHVVLVGMGWGSWLGLTLLAHHPQRCLGLLAVHSPRSPGQEANDAYRAPFPDAGHGAALRAHLALRPDVALLKQAGDFLQQGDLHRYMLAQPAQSCLSGPPALKALLEKISKSMVAQAETETVHFSPEPDESLARAALSYFAAG